MLTNEQLKQQLMANEHIEHVDVGGDGHHYFLTIVSSFFEGKTKVARQQWVYSLLKDDIMSGRLHAVEMKTLTQKEWEKHHG